jgi:hypothetical protein
MHLNSPRFGDIAKVIIEKDNFLTTPFTKKEVQDAILPWNIIRHLAQMVSWLSFIKTFRKPLKETSF